MRQVVLALAFSLVALAAHASEEQWPPPQAQPPRATAPRVLLWDAAKMAEAPAQMLTLRGPDKQPRGTVSVQRMKALVEIQKKIEQQAGLSARLLVQEGTQPNAASAPTAEGNLVAINLGMLELIGDDLDEYAAVLGHEYAHLALHHRDARQQREQVRSGLSTLLGLALRLGGVPFGGNLASLGTSAVSNIYSRDEERDADRTGLTYAANAGYDPAAAVRLWRRMAVRGGTSIPFLSTHPAPSERVENMGQLAEQLKRERSATPSAPAEAQ